MSSPNGPTVVVTRSAADNRSLAAQLQALNFAVVEVPLIEVRPPQDRFEGLRTALLKLERYSWMALTSANAVEALRLAGVPSSWPSSVRIATVGPATASSAETLGLSVDRVPDVATVDGLVASFPQSDPPGERVLAPLAELAGSALADGLAAKGYKVHRVTAYRTEAPSGSASRLDRSEVAAADAVLFFSPSAVDRFVERFGSVRPPLAVCIGPTTADGAAAHGDWEIVTASAHDESGVITAVKTRLDPYT